VDDAVVDVENVFRRLGENRQLPAPRPPLAARPKELSLTRVEVLIRDPFAIYADKVLRLRPLKPLRRLPDARDRGTVIHEVLERFVRERPEGETPEDARARLLALTKAVLADQVPWPAERLIWAARMRRAAGHFLAEDSAGGVTRLLEARGELWLPGLDFLLFGTPDRVDEMPDGRLALFDYKTGTPPTKKQMKSYAKQLHLAALLAVEGGFRTLGPMEVARIAYIGLGGDGKKEEAEITPEVIAEVREGIRRLVMAYARRDQGYASRRAVFSDRQQGDFDHLARYGEWEMTDPPIPQTVGDADDDA